MNICAISDLHGNLINIEECDLLFICGDVVPLKIQANDRKSLKWLKEEFIPWINSLPVETVFMVAGNHDFVFERGKNKVIELFNDTKVKLLYNEEANYTLNNKTYVIWGSPLCHRFGNWAFMPDNEIQLEEFNKMPNNVDFLITHDAAYGRNDIILDKSVYWTDGSHIGNPMLAKVLENKSPRYHFTGHLHSTDHNLVEYNGTKTACVSILGETYKVEYEPFYLEIE